MSIGLGKGTRLTLIRKMKLGDDFSKKLLHVTKSALGIMLVEPNTVMDSLALKLHLGNKRFKGELTSVIKHHEKLSLDDSRLPENVRKPACDLNFWKVGWIEVIDKNLNSKSLVVK